MLSYTCEAEGFTKIIEVSYNSFALNPQISLYLCFASLYPLWDGMIKTDHILFIGSGAFHVAKPSDLIPELQGRLPIRVELDALKTEDFTRILTEPDASLTLQYSALMGTENVTIQFTDCGVKRVAEIAFDVNERTENIGARRLHTVMERLLESVSFEATDMNGETVTIDKKYVDDQLNSLVKDQDLSQFIL